MTGHRMTDAEIRTMKAMYERGEEFTTIATAINRSPAVVSLYLRRKGIYKGQSDRARPMPKQQRAILDYIMAFKAANDGLSPTVREITAAVGASSTSVVVHGLKGLEARGCITFIPGVARNICVVGGQWQAPVTA